MSNNIESDEISPLCREMKTTRERQPLRIAHEDNSSALICALEPAQVLLVSLHCGEEEELHFSRFLASARLPHMCSLPVRSNDSGVFGQQSMTFVSDKY